MSSPQITSNAASSSVSRSSPSIASRDILSFSKFHNSNQNLYTPPFPQRLENPRTQDVSPVERTELFRVSPRTSHVDPFRANPSGSQRRASVQRRTSTRAKTTGSTRNSPTPRLLPQSLQSDRHRGSELDGLATSGSMRPPTSPIPRQFSPRGTVRPSLMKRLAKRLQTPRSRDAEDVATLPIQRAPSHRRQSTRNSTNYRTSRRISMRNSSHKPPSTRVSHTPSVIGTPGITLRSRTPSAFLGAIGSAALIDNDSTYTTESEAEEQPITMRSPRLERARASALAASSAPTERVAIMATAPLDPLADLIEEISGQLERRFSRDTMSSAYEFSLNDYCNAFPAPPTPGTAPAAPWAISHDAYTPISHRDSFPLAEPVVDASTTPPANQAPALRTPSSHPTFGASNAELKLELTLRTSASWDNWSTWPLVAPAPAPANPKAASPLAVTRPNTCESKMVVTSAKKHRSISTGAQWEHHLSILSSGPPSPASPATPPIARPRSLDPLSQARRKTRIVCGQVIDNTEDEDGFVDELVTGRAVDYFAAPAPPQVDPRVPVVRRGSDRSSYLSSLGHFQCITHAPSLSTGSNNKTYSLNSPSDEDESANIGVALTTEYRELASPSPISFSEQEDARLTLYARRKGRQQNFVGKNPPLRVKPPPLLSPAMKSSPSAASATQSPAASVSPGDSSTFEGGIITPNIQNEFVTGRAVPLAPPKRKSFFRYPFTTKPKRSTGSLRVAHLPTNVQGAPPLASPRAKDLPMSATANTFSLNEMAAGVNRQPFIAAPPPPPPSSHATRYTNPTSRFISFSRPSSSRGKTPALPD